jgi:hypothetical protein
VNLTADQFDELFDDFRHSVYRLEALPAYDVGEEDEDFAAWRDGRALPERSIRTSPWLARIAWGTLRLDKQWSRTRVVDDPPTEYERFEFGAYVESQACGDRMRIALRRDVGDVGPDFWLFEQDSSTRTPYAVVMAYDERGCWLGSEKVTDGARVAELIAVRARVDAVSIPLNEYLAGVPCSR